MLVPAEIKNKLPWLFLVIVLIAGNEIYGRFFVQEDQDEALIIKPSMKKNGQSRSIQDVLDLDWLSKRQAIATPKVVNIFPGKNWNPPPPPPPKATKMVAEKPVAPNLPFTFVGSLKEEGKSTVFLSDGMKVIVARQNDVLLSSYQVMDIQSGQIIFNYLPLNQQQSLSTGK
ncbi:hypothetical protein ACMYR3_03705 [Ampullimonas aquatilis]|uniref:hypothetical protein n=1 Tax=Ampullimonas aquatilis TaxID=1341549 RepID=UPI003C73C217